MEEILASIRRIIADDQPLSGASGEAADDRPVATRPTQPVPHDRDPGHDPMPSQHGIVASPQYPTLDGTSGVMETRHPLAPQPEPDEVPVPAVAATQDDIYEISTPEPDAHEDALRDMHEEPDARAAMVGSGHDIVEGLAHEGAGHEEARREPPQLEEPAPRAAAGEPPMSAHERSEGAPTSGLFSASTSQSLAAAFNTLAISRLADNSDELRGLARDMLQPLLKDWLDAHLPGLVESIIREEIERMARRSR